MTDKPRPGESIEIDGATLTLMTAWQTQPGTWWALDADGKAQAVERSGGEWRYIAPQ